MANPQEVNFGPKDSWQKPDCLFCPRPATQQANLSNENKTAAIRCCAHSICEAKALETAQSFVNGGAS